MLIWILIAAGILVVVVGIGVVASARSGRAGSFRSSLPSEGRAPVRGGARGLEKLKCEECGAKLGPDAISAEDGPVFVSCSYCGSMYQLVEDSRG
jgi:DNA-directed RNA polymerase subunit RPC12/RpoP